MTLGSGASMNPAFGMAQTTYMIGLNNNSQKLPYIFPDCIWIYMTVPFAGAALAALMFGGHLKF